MTEATTLEHDATTDAAPRTPYDDIAYVSATIPRIDPSRLATIGRLHGIDTPSIPMARVLEVGAGDGLNLSAFAAAFPHSQCLAFDLAATPVERGRALARAAGLDNIRIERIDILDAAESLEGEFDYILVHGVYAWVPAPVQEAIFRLIGRVLAPNGIALVSYNALPGQLLSKTLRTMIGDILDDIPAGEEKTERSIALLDEYAKGAKESDNAVVKALRARAKNLAVRPKFLLSHDEFGSCFEPHLFEDVCAAAEKVGLAYLNDSVYLPWEHGFPGQEIDEATLRRSIQIHDYQTGCLFRHSMFVRRGVPIRRTFDPALAEPLLLSSTAQPEADGKYSINGEAFEINDQRMDVILREAARRYPEQLSLEGLSADRITVLVRLFLGNGVLLAAAPAAAAVASERPRISPLARAQIERGDPAVAGLDRTMTPLSDDFRRLLVLLDGTRDARQLAAEVDIGVGEAQAFIGLVAMRGLLMR